MKSFNNMKDLLKAVEQEAKKEIKKNPKKYLKHLEGTTTEVCPHCQETITITAPFEKIICPVCNKGIEFELIVE